MSTQLPQTFGLECVEDLTTGLDSEVTDIVLHSYASLSLLAESIHHDNIDMLFESMRSYPVVSKSYERLVSSADRAFAVVCRSMRTRISQDVESINRECRMLAKLIER